MRNSEITPMNPAAAEVDHTQPVAPVNPAIAMIDEGNALEEQGRIPEAMALYEAAIKIDPQCTRVAG
jgi:hypothetical protein